MDEYNLTQADIDYLMYLQQQQDMAAKQKASQDMLSGALELGTGGSSAYSLMPDTAAISDAAASYELPSFEAMNGIGGANMLGTLSPAILAAIAGYTGYAGLKAIKNAQNSSKNPITGFKEGLKAAGALKYVPVLGQLPALAGAASALFGSGKDKDQVQRDSGRKKLKELGVIDDKYQLHFSDGSTFDIGKDGSFQNYNIDFNNQNEVDSIGGLQGLAALLSQGKSDKTTSDFTGYYAKATGGDKNKMKELYTMHGLDQNSAVAALGDLYNQSKDNAFKQKILAYQNGINELYSGKSKSMPKPIQTAVIPKAPVAAPAVQPVVQKPQAVLPQSSNTLPSKTDMKNIPRDNMMIPKTKSRLFGGTIRG